MHALFAHDEQTTKIKPKKKGRRKRFLGKAALIIFFISLAVYTGIRLRLGASIQVEKGHRIIPGLSKDITIYRDSLGIPYIEADSEEELMFATGYAMASDRLWQMFLLKHASQGRLAEILGEDALALDMYIRSLGLPHDSTLIYAKADPRLKLLTDKFAQGVNAYVNSKMKTPLEFILTRNEFGTWTGKDSMDLFQIFNFMLAGNHVEELAYLKLAAGFTPEKAVWLFPTDQDEDIPFSESEKIGSETGKLLSFHDIGNFMGHKTFLPLFNAGLPASNNYAISGKKSSTGKSMIANDTHLQLTMPSSWYIMNLSSPTYKAAGVALPGVPFVALGTNGKLSWGATMVMADNQDIFLEKIRKQGKSTQYLYKGKWLNAKLRKETIQVKGKSSVVLEIPVTVHGPLLNTALSQSLPEKYVSLKTKTNYGIAYKHSLADGDNTSRGFYQLAKAKTMKEAEKAIRNIDGIYLNLVYGNADDIAWSVTGKYPRRKKGKGMLPSPGWTGEYDWNGYHPPGKNPSVKNPKNGFLATANNKTTGKKDIHLSSSFYSQDRSDRIKRILAKGKKFTFDEFAKIQQDTTSLHFLKVKKLLTRGSLSLEIKSKISAINIPEMKARANEAFTILEKFDGNMNANSSSALVAQTFYHNFVLNTFQDNFSAKLGAEKDSAWDVFQAINMRSYNAPQDHMLQRDDSPFWDNAFTPVRETKADIIVKSLQDAISSAEEICGKDRAKWQWGKAHKYHWKHEIAKKVKFFSFYFNRGPSPASGDMHTVNVAGTTWGDSYDVWLIPAMRFLADYSAKEPAYLVTHSGISGNPESEHYDDMIPYFLEFKRHPLPMNRENILKQYTNKFMLKKAN